MKDRGYLKDAAVLFVITLISGLLLGGAYGITKEPIEKANQTARTKAYQAVFPDAADFTSDAQMEVAIKACNEALPSQSFGSVSVDDGLRAVDGGGTLLGYVVTAHSADSYSGTVKLTVGIRTDGTINGIEFLEISDTPGLGLKAKEPAFKDQYEGKKAETLMVTKSGNPGDGEIDAISGATITSSAVTNAVNGALYLVHESIDQEAGK